MTPKKGNGERATTTPGYTNRNGQVVVRGTGLAGTDHGQYIYVMRCSKCSTEYGANGSDIFQRRCPKWPGRTAGPQQAPTLTRPRI